jgi:acylphosphatase
MPAARLLISGIVQGVGYRAWTVRTARQLGASGWVRNLHDGRVEVWAEAPSEVLDQLEERCRRGPTYAEVERVERSDRPATGAAGFEALATAADPLP